MELGKRADELGISLNGMEKVFNLQLSEGEQATQFGRGLQALFSNANVGSTASQQGTFPGLSTLSGAGDHIQEVVDLIGDDPMLRGEWVSEILFQEKTRDTVTGTIGVVDDRPINLATGMDAYADRKAIATLEMSLKQVSWTLAPYAIAGTMPWYSGNIQYGNMDVTLGSLLSQAVLYKYAAEVLKIMKDRRAQAVAEAAASTLTPAPSACWPTAGTMKSQVDARIAAIRTACGLTTLSRQAFGLLLVNDAIQAARADGVTSGTGLTSRYQAVTMSGAIATDEDVRHYLDIGEVKSVEMPRLNTTWGSDAWVYIRNAGPTTLPPRETEVYSHVRGNLEPLREGLTWIYPVFEANQTQVIYTGGGLGRIVKPNVGT